MSVASLLAAPRARALFHRAICQSGAADHVLSQAQANQVAEAFLGELGGRVRSRDALAQIPTARLMKAQGATNRLLANLERLMVFLPCVDGDLIPEPPIDAVRRGATAHLPLMIGTTLDEWKLFTPLDSGVLPFDSRAMVQRMVHLLPRVAKRAPEPKLAAWQYQEAVRARGGRTTPFEVWTAFQSARVFHYPASLLAEAQARAQGSVYSYLFTWRPPALRRTIGACHALDVPFVFGFSNHPMMRPFGQIASPASRLSQRMQHAWIEFARSGHPGHSGLPDWEGYEPENRATMVFGRKSYLADAPLEPERKLWERWR